MGLPSKNTGVSCHSFLRGSSPQPRDRSASTTTGINRDGFFTRRRPRGSPTIEKNTEAKAEGAVGMSKKMVTLGLKLDWTGSAGRSNEATQVESEAG